MKTFYFIICVGLLFFADKTHAFVTEAKNAIAIDGKTGEVIFEHNAYEQMSPSSMSKLMTLYIAFGKLKDGSLKEDDLCTVSKLAWKRGGSSMFLKEKQKISVKELINGIAVVSGNDASITIAEAIKGTQDSFVVEMNKCANKLGLKNSHFSNSTGWPEDNHYMTAYDVAILARRIFYDFNEYYNVFSEPNLEYNGVKQTNTNELLFKNGTEVKIDGIKTGSSDAAGYGVVVSAYNKDGERIFVVVNGLENSRKRFTEAQRIVNHIFDNFEFKTIYKKDQTIENIKVYYGKDKKVGVATNEDVFIVRKNKDNNDEIKIHFKYYNAIKAPIKKGDKVGNLVVKLPNRDDKEFNLYTTKDVEELPFAKKIAYKIFGFSNTKK